MKQFKDRSWELLQSRAKYVNGNDMKVEAEKHSSDSTRRFKIFPRDSIWLGWGETRSKQNACRGLLLSEPLFSLGKLKWMREPYKANAEIEDVSYYF